METIMSSLKKMSSLVVYLLIAMTSPLRCSSFAPPPRLTPSTVSCPPIAAAANDDDKYGIRMQQQTLAATFAAIMTLATPIVVAPHAAHAAGISFPSSSIVSTISNGLGGKEDISSIILASSTNNNNKNVNANDDEIVIDVLTRETRADEKTAAKDARKARIEKSREAFFDYEARMAEETEDRIEAAEMKAEVEIQIDKKRIQKLKEMELKAEKEADVAETPKEKAARLRKVKELAKLEKDAERKERKAERAEKIYLAEEKQEKLILQQKEEAALKVRIGN